MRWITLDDLGVIAWQTRKDCKKAVPSFRQVRCEFAFFRGWLAMDPYGSELKSTIQTPDGRKIPVVSGFNQTGRVIGFRGGIPRAQDADTFRALMARAIESDLEFSEYKRITNPTC